MIDTFLSHDELGENGAYRKAQMLVSDMGYRIISIEHTMVPMAGSTSSPYSSTWGKSERGYCITVDTEGYRQGEDRRIPTIRECLS